MTQKNTTTKSDLLRVDLVPIGAKIPAYLKKDLKKEAKDRGLIYSRLIASLLSAGLSGLEPIK